MVAFAAAIALTVAPATAGATPKIPSQLAFAGYDQPSFTFHGSVSSPSKKCEPKRKVVFSDDGTALTTTTTKANGAFTVSALELGPTIEDGFSGAVKPRKIGKPGKKKVCKGDSAEVIVGTYETTFASIDLNTAGSYFVVGSLSSSLPECTRGRGIELWVDDGGGGGPAFVQGDGTLDDGTFVLGNPDKGGAWDVRVADPVDIIAAQENGDLIFGHCEAPNPTDSDDITVVEDTPGISINYDGNTPEFYGHLSSNVPGCLADRTVDLYDGNDYLGSSGVDPNDGFWHVDGIFANEGDPYTAEINDVTVIGDFQPFTVCTDVQSG